MVGLRLGLGLYSCLVCFRVRVIDKVWVKVSVMASI
jgi:hypothetical protein